MLRDPVVIGRFVARCSRVPWVRQCDVRTLPPEYARAKDAGSQGEERLLASDAGQENPMAVERFGASEREAEFLVEQEVESLPKVAPFDPGQFVFTRKGDVGCDQVGLDGIEDHT